MSFSFVTNDDTNSMRCSGLIQSQMQRFSVNDSPENDKIEDPSSDDDDDDLGSCSSGSSSIGRNSDVGDQSSSIGRNSDVGDQSSSDGEDSTEETDEVQSKLKEPLDTMDSLADALPMRKGISNYYTGRSKSFTSLADAVVAPSAKDLAKPDNPYNKKRKGLLASSLLAKNRNRSMMSLSTAASTSNSRSSSPSSSRPPLHPQVKKPTPVVRSSSPTAQPNPPCRSFSLTDLQFVVASTPNIGGLVVHRRNNDKKSR